MIWRLPENPFVGLRPFETEETLLFFGRHEQTRDLLQQLHETRYLAVVGSSGCGKSSLIRAGLIPRLLGGFLVEDRDTWLVARMKPGQDPILNLGRALHQAASGNEDPTDVASIVETIHEQGLEGVLDYLTPLMQPSEANLLLLVDQFEEIFRFSALNRTHQDLEVAVQFVSIMLGLAEQRHLPIYVTMTMRSDYLGDCDAFMGLPEALNRSQYLVPRLTRQGRREAIEGPVRLYRGDISNRLVDRLLNQTGEARDDLPILQHALMRTWDYAHQNGENTWEGVLDLVHYEAVGTVESALSRHAEEALEGMDVRARSLAKQLFQALTEVDPGSRRIRRPVRLDEIEAITGAGAEELWPIIQKFRSQGRSFLVLSSENPEDDPLIDISHESLIRQWERLNRWVDEEVESADIYRRLAETARLHREGKAGFYRDPDLQIAVNWRETKHPNQFWAERYNPGFEEALDFLKESLDESEKEIAEKEKTRQRELEAAQALAKSEKQRAEDQIRAATRLRRRALYLTAVLILALVAFTFAIVARGTAEANAKLAQQQANAAAIAQGEAIQQANTATIAQGEAIAAQGTAVANAQLAELQAITATNAQGEAIAAKGTAEAAATNEAVQRDNTQRIANQLASNRAFSGAQSSLGTQPDLSLLLSLEALFLDESNLDALGILLTGLQRRTQPAIESSPNEFILDTTLFGHEDFIWSLAFSPDGKTLASGSADDTIILRNTDSWEINKTLIGHNGDVLSVAFSPDGSILASGSTDNTVILWNPDDGRSITTLGNHTNWVNSVAFSPDGKVLASGSADDTIRLWNLESYEPIGEPLRANRGNVKSVDFSPDGGMLAASYGDSEVIIWDIRDRDNIRSFTLPRVHKITTILSVSFSPDGSMIVSSGADLDPLVVIWDTNTREPIGTLSGHRSRIFSLSFNKSGKLLASSSSDNTVRIWDVDKNSLTFGQQVVEPLRVSNDWVLSVSFNPEEENMLASAGTQGRILIWKQPVPDAEQPSTRQLGNILGTHGNDGIGSVAFSSDGTKLSSVSANGEIILWDVETGEQIGETVQPRTEEVMSVAISHDGTTLATGSRDGSILLWDTQDGEEMAKLQGVSTTPATSLSFSPDGTYLASSSEEDTSLVVWWDFDSPEPSYIELDDSVAVTKTIQTFFSPDSHFLASGMSDNKILLFEIPSGKLIREFTGGHSEPVLSLAFSPGGESLASGSEDDNIIIWDVESGEIKHNLFAHTGDVTSLAFNTKGNWLVSGSEDKTLILWDVETGKQIGEAFELHTEGVMSVAFSPDDKFMISGGADNTVILWDMDVDSWKSLACELAGRKLTVDEWKQYLPDFEYNPICSPNPIRSSTTTPTPNP